MEYLIDIPGRLHSVALEKHVAGADQIYDDVLKTTLDILNLENITDVKVQDNKLQFLNIKGLVLKEISIASGTQKQSDWNLTNSTQVDFIKNKPTVYNKLEVDDKLITKQDTIDDLATIRSGAQAGATAYQKPATGIPATDLASDVQNDLAAIDGIEEVIPEQASATNKLADKNFVNSSIATATATYRGAYNLVTDLHLSVSATHAEIATALATAIQTADNNDYCYVQIPVADATPTEFASVERYKFNGNAWEYEYTLNNSGFTAAQWAAINSYITSNLVTKLSALPTNSELITLLNGKANTSDLDEYAMLDNANTFTKGQTIKTDGYCAVVKGDSIDIYSLATPNHTPRLQIFPNQINRTKVGGAYSGVVWADTATQQIPAATTSAPGLMSAEDKGKLNDLPTATELAQEMEGKADSADLAEVATSGSYNDLSDTPTIPDITDKADKVSNATNGNFAALDSNGNLIDSGHKHSDYLTQHQDLSNYVQKSQTAGLLKNDGTVDTTQYLTQHQDISGKADKSEMSVVPGTGADADKTTITLKQGTSATVLTAHLDVADKEDKMPIIQVASGTTAINAAVNTYYEVAGEVGALAITLPTPTDSTKVAMVVIHLLAGTTPNVVIGSTAVIDYSAAYDISAGNEYEINCMYNGDKWVVADMEVV